MSDALFGDALPAAVAAREPLVVAHGAALAPDATRATAWLAALGPVLGAGRVPPRANVTRRERAPGLERHAAADAHEYVAILASGRERWTLHGAREVTHDLDAGAVVYVPCGTAVTIATASAAQLWYLGFAFPSWIDLVAHTAMLELAASAAWRAPITRDDPESAAVARAIAALQGLRLP